MEYPPAVGELLTFNQPMDLGPGSPRYDELAKLKRLSLDKLFAPRVVKDTHAALACLSGLHLCLDDLHGSHKISQDLPTPEGSFWHGIMHRREGDFSNAKYWFRRVVNHPVFEEIGRVVKNSAENTTDAPDWMKSGQWDPFQFVDLVEECIAGRSSHYGLCVRIQMCEWVILFDFCYRNAIMAN